MAEPTSPPPAPGSEEQAAPAAAAPPLVRRWRALEAFADRRASYRETEKQRHKYKIVFALLVGIMMLLGAFVGLLSWVHPIAGSYLVPLWITEYESRLLPINAQADPDRAALQNGGYFPTIDENAFASQERHLLVQDLAALKDRRTGPVVVYLCAFACRGEDGEVTILPADANAVQTRSRLPLRQVLHALYDCPAREKLLVLDLMRPWAGGRIGILEDEAATLIHAEVEDELASLKKKGKDVSRQGLVLCAASPGQLALTSEGLGRSVFGFYFEEALRGWGAGYNTRGIRNNRVTVEDLANFVRVRVDRWAVQNRATRQTPVLLGAGPDFALTALEHGQPLPHLEPPETPAYPKWLHEGWQLRDNWLGQWQHRVDQRLIGQVEATLLRAEQEWRGGVDADRVRTDLKARLDVLRARDERIRAVLPRPTPRSLAFAVGMGMKPDPAVLTDLKAVVLGFEQIPKGAKPEDATKAKQKLLTDFQTKHKAAPYFDIAYAVFETLADETELTAEIVLALDGILLQRQPAPTYIETYFVRQLSALASEGEATWPRRTIRLALEVVRKGEQAVLAGAQYPWVRDALDAACRKRYDAEVVLLSRGYAPPDSAHQLYQEAREGYDVILDYEETLRAADRTREDVYDFLPFYQPFLERNPANAGLFKETAKAALELDQALTPPPASAPALIDTALFERVKAIGLKADAVRARLDDLRWPFGADRRATLIAQSKLPEVTPAGAAAVDAILSTPFLRADERVALWTAGRELGGKLHTKTRDIDNDEDERGVRTARQTDYALERARFEANQRSLAVLRGEASVDLLEMGGLKLNSDLHEALRAVRQRRQGFVPRRLRSDDGKNAQRAVPPIQELGIELRAAWTGHLPTRIQDESDLNLKARLSRIVPPLDSVPALEDLRSNPAIRIRADEARQQWAWLVRFYRYQSRDLEGSPFYADVAVEYQRVVQPGPETYVQIAGPAAVSYLTRFNPSFSSELRVALFADRQAETPVRLSVLTADDDWLRVRVGQEPLKALEKAEAEFRSAQVPIQIALKQGAELSRTPRPRGFLVLATAAGQTFHHRVTVPGLPLPADERVEALLSADPAGPTAPVASLRLRPVAGRQPYYLYVRNTTAKPRNVIVQIKIKDAVIKHGEAKLAVPPKSFRPVNFMLPALAAPGAPPAAPPPAPAAAVAAAATPAPLPELEGPLHFVVLDADRPTEVLDEKLIDAGIASPREYVQITAAQFSPPAPSNGNKNRLEVRLKALGTLAGPPCRVQLVLPPERIPGFLSAKDGSFSGILPAAGGDLILYANGIRLDEGSSPEGHFHLNVDGLERAYIFKCTFARQGEPTTPREDTSPAIRLKADLLSQPVAKYPVRMEVDNPPAGSNLELMLSRIAGGAFETDLIQKYPKPRLYHLGFSPENLDGSLLFDASIRDVTLSLNASGVEGSRELRGYLLKPDGSDIDSAALDVVFDASAPDRVRFVNPPSEAMKGAILTLSARGSDDESGIKKVIFFLGSPPADGKLLPTMPQVEGKPTASVWTAQLPLTPDRRGDTDVSVQFINGVGLSTFATTQINILDGEKKAGPGRIVGVVQEGMNPQADMEVILSPTDAKTPQEKEKATKTTKTKPDGSYVFEDVAPGKYTLSCTKLISGRAATATVEVAADQTVTQALSLVVK
jgi:hypothetical protein